MTYFNPHPAKNMEQCTIYTTTATKQSKCQHTEVVSKEGHIYTRLLYSLRKQKAFSGFCFDNRVT